MGSNISGGRVRAEKESRAFAQSTVSPNTSHFRRAPCHNESQGYENAPLLPTGTVRWLIFEDLQDPT